MDSPLELMLAHALFEGIKPSRLVRLIGSAEAVEFPAGTKIVEAGDRESGLFLMKSACVQLSTPSGRVVQTGWNACGEELLAGVDCHALEARAVEAATGWTFTRVTLRELVQDQPIIGQRAVALLAARLAEERLPDERAAKKSRPAETGVFELLGWGSAIVLPPLAYWIGLQSALTIPAAMTTAICTAMIVMWVFSLVDEFIPPLIAMVATLFIGLAPPAVALAGFSSPGLVTLLGVFSLAAIITASGLSYRLMLWLLVKLPDRPIFHQAVLLLGGYLLSPITPSGNNRLSLLLPLYREMLDGLRLPRGGVAATALMAATFSGAMLMSPMLSTSKSANIAAITLLPPQTQEEFIGLFWLVASAVAAIGMTLLHWLVSRLMLKVPPVAPLPKPRLALQLRLLGPLSASEWLAVGGFLFFLVGAATYAWHRVPPSWLAGCVLIGLLLSGHFSKQDFRRQIDWPMLFFLLGVDSITRVMDYHHLQTGLATVLSESFVFVNGRIEFFILAALVTTLLVRLALPVTAGMLVSVVILLPVAEAHGVHPWICVFLAALFSDIWFLPYQSSVYLQVMSQGFGDTFDRGTFFRYNFWMNLSRIIVAYVSLPWWSWLGLH